MRTLRILVLLPALAVALAACADSSACACTNTTAAAATVPGAETSGPPANDTTPNVTTLDDTVVDDTVPGTVAEGPVQIDVVVGTDSGPDRVEKVRVGSDITLNITNPNAADEYHVHVIDLEQKADAGVMSTMNFTVDQPGTYEVESHVTEDILLVIEVV
jgi:glucose/arabinose dehydrogenase